MEFETDDDRAKPDTLIDAFARHCVGKINEIYERYVFHRRLQEPGESFATFVGDLRRLAKSCGYSTAEDSMIRDRIVIGIREDATRKKLLQTRTLDMAKAIDIGRSSEATTCQLKAMTTPDELHALRQHHQESRSRHRSSSRYRRGKSRGHKNYVLRALIDVAMPSASVLSATVSTTLVNNTVRPTVPLVRNVRRKIILHPYANQSRIKMPVIR
jgi:hypothetical protein